MRGRTLCRAHPDDLDGHPVWEFALGEERRKGQDEATVGPCKVSGVLDPADGMFVMRASLTLADGTWNLTAEP